MGYFFSTTIIIINIINRRNIIMIIKYYGYAFPQNLNIIEDVTDVLVHAGLHTATEDNIPVGPNIDHAGIVNHYTYDLSNELFPGIVAGANLKADDAPRFLAAKFIDFTRNGIRCRLAVYGRAYVCNNDGKTIEKVDPENR